MSHFSDLQLSQQSFGLVACLKILSQAGRGVPAVQLGLVGIDSEGKIAHSCPEMPIKFLVGVKRRLKRVSPSRLKF